jgi:glycosyltransferase involved in cell wall biosynthesis
MQNGLRFSVIINNYNYGRFVVEAVRSALVQTRQPHEVIVVDDGSTDDSLTILKSEFGQHPQVRIHSQPNRGQLAAIRQGVMLASGDWCFFLDADDIYLPRHLEEAARVLEANPEVGAYYSDHIESEGPPLYRSKWAEGTIGPVAALVCATGKRFGTITSTLGLSRHVALRAVELDSSYDLDWRIRADDCLIFGASCAGAVIYFHARPNVRYRIHGNNSFAGQHNAQTLADYRYNLAKRRLLRAYAVRNGIEDSQLMDLLWRELRLNPNHRQPRIKRAFVRSLKRVPGRSLRRLKFWLRMVRY